MKTTTLSALLLLSTLAVASAQAHYSPYEPIVSTDGVLEGVNCLLDPLDGDGHHDHVSNAWVNVDLLDQDGSPCWT